MNFCVLDAIVPPADAFLSSPTPLIIAGVAVVAAAILIALFLKRKK